MIGRKDIGKHVADAAGRVGILRDVIKDYADPAQLPWERKERPTAFLQKDHGGTEWLVPVADVRRI